MFKNHPGFNFIFLLIFIVQLMSGFEILTEMFLFEGVHYFSKPLITISLLFWLVYYTNLKGRYSKSTAFGLIAGLLGDVLLMFSEDNPNFFIAGLISFLIGHLFYARAFYIDYSLNKTVNLGYRKNALIAYGFYIIIFLLVLLPHLGNLIIPVFIYALVISLMGVLAVCRSGRVNSLSFKAVFIGSILFVISDSILAYNKFVSPVPLASLFIMSTYMLAQYFIVKGNIERKIKRRVEDI